MSERAGVIESKSTTSKKSLYEVSETPQEVVVSIGMPGVSKENVSLQATENRLHVDAECKRGISMRRWGILGQERIFKRYRKAIQYPPQQIQKTRRQHSEMGSLRSDSPR